MVWKVAGEFVSPKNMTVGSNSLWLVINAAFHSSDVNISVPLSKVDTGEEFGSLYFGDQL